MSISWILAIRLLRAFKIHLYDWTPQNAKCASRDFWWHRRLSLEVVVRLLTCGGRWHRHAWMRFALAFALALGLAVMSGAAQRSTILTNGRNLQIPINHGLPDKPLGFTFCRLRYQNIRRARKSGWGDDYPQADYNFMVRLSELTKTKISRWNNGDPGFANVTAMDPNLFLCPYLRMQNAANYDFTPDRDRTHARLLAEGRLSLDRR